ncbi:MAG: hypothetical protein HW407_1531, partial [Bacteroidetes bacterium]|nr:hypothetical protein [Bacteroidota bacterium]
LSAWHAVHSSFVCAKPDDPRIMMTRATNREDALRDILAAEFSIEFKMIDKKTWKLRLRGVNPYANENYSEL